MKVILITGAAHGIGRASAERLMAEGYIVYGGDIDYDAMEDLEKNGMHRLKMDVTKEDEINDGIEVIINEQKRLDGLFANAGYACMGILECVDIEDAKQNFEVNLFGVARCIKAVLPHMRNAAFEGKGRIVVCSSGTGKMPIPGMSWYPATKHALEAYCDGLRMEMKASFPGIKVSIIEPGLIPTKMFEHSLPTWQKANQSEYAEIYREELDNFKINFEEDIMNGSPVETVSDAVFKAFEAKEPKQRYTTNKDAKQAIFAKKFFEGADFLDNAFIKMFLKKRKKATEPVS